MKQILVYSDSLSWGIIPETRQRFEFHRRWPGVMENQLVATGKPVRVIEDCLNGRRTVCDDPYKPGRNGLTGLEQRIEINSPLSLVIVMLGTNDFQSMHNFNAWHSAKGVEAVIQSIRRAPIEPGMPLPEILVVAPPRVQQPAGTMSDKFRDAGKKSEGLATMLQQVSSGNSCHFFDAASVTSTSRVDGVHLDEDQHLELGKAMARVVESLI